MPHQSIEPDGDDQYYAGDAIDIPFAFVEIDGTTEIDITGMTVEFRVKESLVDDDQAAILEKVGTDGENEDDISFTDPSGGECVVHIETGDTEELIMEGNERVDNVLLRWHVRITDTTGNRVTSETGDWQIFAS